MCAVDCFGNDGNSVLFFFCFLFFFTKKGRGKGRKSVGRTLKIQYRRNVKLIIYFFFLSDPKLFNDGFTFRDIHDDIIMHNKHKQSGEKPVYIIVDKFPPLII